VRIGCRWVQESGVVQLVYFGFFLARNPVIIGVQCQFNRVVSELF